MTKSVKVRAIGNSSGVVLPKEVLERLRVSTGDELHLVETTDGYILTPYDPEFDKQMASAEAIMRKRKNVLKKLSE